MCTQVMDVVRETAATSRLHNPSVVATGRVRNALLSTLLFDATRTIPTTHPSWNYCHPRHTLTMTDAGGSQEPRRSQRERKQATQFVSGASRRNSDQRPRV